jgi:hypothetical protein
LKNLLNEEYKYSDNLFNSIKNKLSNAYSRNINKTIVDTPSPVRAYITDPKDSIYLSPKVTIGFAMYLILNIEKKSASEIKNIIGITNNNITFNDLRDLSKIYVENSTSMIPVNFYGIIPFQWRRGKSGKIDGMATLTEEMIPEVAIDRKFLGNSLRDSEMIAVYQVLRHELQHVTSYLNGIGVMYFNRLKKLNYDFSKLQTLKMSNLTDQEHEFIFTKISNSKFNMITKKSRDELKSFLEDPNLTDDDKNYRKYVFDTAEYYEHLSDTLNRISIYMLNIQDYSIWKKSSVKDHISDIYYILSESDDPMRLLKEKANIHIDTIIEFMKNNDKFVEAFNDESFNEYLKFPAMEARVVKDLKRYLPIRLKKIFDKLFPKGYPKVPQDKYDENVEEIFNNLKLFDDTK